MKPNILFVCGRNQWRSPTAAEIYKRDQRFNSRSAGLSPKSKHQINISDIEWADLILVMENSHRSRIRSDFRDYDLPRIECLDIPDDFQYMDEDLIGLIKEGTECFLEQ